MSNCMLFFKAIFYFGRKRLNFFYSFKLLNSKNCVFFLNLLNKINLKFLIRFFKLKILSVKYFNNIYIN